MSRLIPRFDRIPKQSDISAGKVKIASSRFGWHFQERRTPIPQMIVLDLTMPVMDGVAFRQAQQQDPHLSAIPVVVMSAVEELLAPMVLGDAYLPKPIDFDALLPLVEQYCEQSRQRGMEVQQRCAVVRLAVPANRSFAPSWRG